MGICLIVKSGGGIDTSSATVTADKILSGYTIYSNDNKVTGTMANIGAQTESGKGVGSSTTIKAGWHNGNGVISASELKSQMAATTASVGDVLANYTYWTNGSNSRYTGTMANRGTKTWSIGANGSQTIESGWHNGNGTVKQSINVDNGEWGPNPTTTNQQLCWQGWYYSKNRWCYGSSALTASNIKKDITIFGVKGTWEDTTKKFIIKNGQLVSTYGPYLWFAIGKISNTPGETMIWNNTTWHLIGGYNIYAYDEDSVRHGWKCMLVVPSVTKAMAVSWTNRGSDIYSGSFKAFNMNGIVCGDVVCGPVIRGNVSSRSYNITFWVGVVSNLFSGGGRLAGGYRHFIKGGYNWSSYNQYSMTSSGLSGMSSSDGRDLQEGCLYVKSNIDNLIGTLDDYTFNVWAKNLWIDTSKSFSF